MLTRRRFLQASSLFALAPTVPLFVARTAQAAAADKDRRILVVVELNGGNDALNTVIPYADPTYEKLRPKLKIAKKELLSLSASVGLHPSLKPLDKLWQAGHLAVLPGVGYPNPNRSHFESMAIWQTARLDPEEQNGYGWLGRALDPQAGSAYLLGSAVPTALRGRRSTTVSLNRVEEVLLADPASAKQAIGGESADDLLAFVRRQSVDANAAADKLAHLAGGNDGSRYPATALAERLKLAARLIRSNLGARVFYTVQSGYDTHAVQAFAHGNLLEELAGAIAAFFNDLTQAKLADRVILLTFSEFGRTIKENGSAGTDHGTAGAVFLAGPGVRGGVATTMPSLTELAAGEPKMTADFRGVYTAVLEDWLGLPAKEVLAGTFDHPPLFRA
ncbi:MAG TPA: DUF1501 domain-containing protein [Gemmataceae bacterium]|nr:DUF1501 domain-containing protein [Gemmataceae bacterium]